METILESESLSGIKFSSVYFAFTYGFLFMFITIYIPRVLFYLIYLGTGRRIKKMMWLMNVKVITFFFLCTLGVTTLALTFFFSAMLTNTFGTGLMYMIILFMVPVTLFLLLDLYLCLATKDYLEERIWLA